MELIECTLIETCSQASKRGNVNTNESGGTNPARSRYLVDSSSFSG